MRRGFAAIVLLAILTVATGIAATSAPPAPRATFVVAAPVAPAPVGRQPAGPEATQPPSAVMGDEADGDEGMDPTAVYLNPDTKYIQVYADAPSILPGQTLRLHTSTAARRYSVTVYRESTGAVRVFTRSGYAGHNYKGRKTVDPAMHTVRANWPVTVSISTRGWLPGVYTVYAKDSSGHSSGTVFVVRSPSTVRNAVLFVLPVMDYEAYNGWGTYNFYSNPSRAYQVSFDRPYNSNGGLSFYPNYDRYTLRWLLRAGYRVTYTTDYDLAMRPPATAPAVLLLPQHTEYVNKTLFDWVDQHVNSAGDMNVAYFGANSFFWQVRLVPGPHGSSRPDEIQSYKNCQIDPMTAVDPAIATCRWYQLPTPRPESLLFGAMYSGVVDGGHIAHDEVVTSAMPAWALAGTGWHAGTVLRGLMLGEADYASPADGGTAIATGTAPYILSNGTVLTLSGEMTIYTSTAGARVFDAGTFLYGGVLGKRASVGVSWASFDRFTRNVMLWLGLAART